MDNLGTEDPTTMLATLHDDAGLQTWSEDKKRDFAATFDARVLEARFILATTAGLVQEIAERRRFISAKHIKQIDRKLSFPRNVAMPNMNLPGYWEKGPEHDQRRTLLSRCRSVEELHTIAEQRAAAIVSALPPLNKAVQLIDKTTATAIVQRDKLQAEAQALADELDEAPTTISLAEVDQDMSIAAFRKMVEDAKDVRDGKIRRLAKIAKRGVELEQQISKALYVGLPGLSEAVVDTIVAHFERAMALVEIGRRVGEKVMFGDSDAAMQILSTFEHDEVKVNDDMTRKVADAMAKLRGDSKPAKQLAKKGK